MTIINLILIRSSIYLRVINRLFSEIFVHKRITNMINDDEYDRNMVKVFLQYS